MNSAIQPLVRMLLPLALATVLVACGSTPAPTSSNHGSRYSIQQDRAPSREVDIASIPDVVPEPVNRTRAGNVSPYTVLGKTYTVLPTEEGYQERGVASWYGEKFHGHQTSNGEIFDMYKVSAAHKSLPIPSYLRVTNLDNNRSIVVRVNDRGPFHGDRIIDLSYAAALKLGYADRGTARVQLEAIVVNSDIGSRTLAVNSRSNTVVDPIAGAKYIQVGAFSSLDTARELSRELDTLTDRPVFIRSINSRENGVLHRVRIGPIENDGEIQSLSRRVVAANLGRPYTVTE
ncbi:MAG: septal ring lytic transglycosylase RlpA family protein [Proteobacteria bacterium]|nr:septal ring lytic transglycosylase RlpA family protein [Pseudomonadota bacterium]MDA0928819.1 septal ring lytic transglycosylase RlpA family protein [Pseudomonadota bacterium]